MEASASSAPNPPADARSVHWRRVLQQRWTQLWPWTPLLFAAAYGLVVLVNFSALITAINMSADVVSAQVIGKLLGSAPHGAEALLGHHAY